MANNRRFSALHVIWLALVFGACAENKKIQPPQPCSVGVDQKTCGLKLTGASRWRLHYNIYDSKAAIKEKRVETQVDVITEFNSSDDNNLLWRRSMTYSKENETPKTMLLAGTVSRLTSDEIDLNLESSTCDGVDQNFYIDSVGTRTLYYKRTGSLLTLQKNKIKTESSGRGGLSGIVSDILTTSVQTIFYQVLDGTIEMYKQAFSFGLLRDQMNGGTGQFKATSDRELFDSHFGYGQIGCFVARDGQFKIGSSQPNIPKW